jgi:hypothetical protein
MEEGLGQERRQFDLLRAELNVLARDGRLTPWIGHWSSFARFSLSFRPRLPASYDRSCLARTPGSRLAGPRSVWHR